MKAASHSADQIRRLKNPVWQSSRQLHGQRFPTFCADVGKIVTWLGSSVIAKKACAANRSQRIIANDTFSLSARHFKEKFTFVIHISIFSDFDFQDIPCRTLVRLLSIWRNAFPRLANVLNELKIACVPAT